MQKLVCNCIFALLIACICCAPVTVFAATAQPQLTPELERLIQQKVEEILAQKLQHIVQNNPHSIAKPTIGKGEQHQIVKDVVNSLTFSGAIEVEANYNSDYDNESSSDLTLATVAFGLDMQAHEWVQGHVLFLYEEDSGDDVVVDEAFVTIGNADATPVFLSVGRMYVPFGNFTTFMVSDPLTLEMAETQETALQVGYADNGLHAALYAFNGETTESNTIEQYGVHAGYEMANDNIKLQFDMSYTSSLFDSDSLTDEFGVFATDGDYVAGLGLHTVVGFSGLTIIGEYITALEDLDVAGDKIDPYTFNIETAYTANLLQLETTFAIAYQGSKDLAGFLPEERYLASLGFNLYEDTALTVEYAYDDDYSTSDGGTGDNAESITAQLAYEF